jgi:hypothetical protein
MLALLLVLATQGPAAGAAQAYPIPRFVDPERRARLAGAFLAVEKYLADQMVKDHVPGLRHRDYVDAQILRPLGLDSTCWEAAAVPAPRLAVGYRHDGEAWSPEPPLGDGAFGAMGGLFTSGHDLARYVAFLLSAWPPREEPDPGPVRRSSLREMQQAWRHSGLRVDRPASDAPLRATTSAYGFGIGVSEDCRFQRIVAHSGGLPGFGSNMRTTSSWTAAPTSARRSSPAFTASTAPAARSPSKWRTGSGAASARAATAAGSTWI